ncbi:MAG: hypothetical protein DRG33_01130 [Deltaproteobacteria bacterium]|nr:MAG: hypothetical protein DRG33_01130 [Deltaproteobacteria bacterium]
MKKILPLLLLILGCATNPVTHQQEFLIFSEGYEIRLGREATRSVLEQFGRYDDRRIQAYVQEVGWRIARVSHRPHLPYSFTVTDSSVPNAMALPGGFIYVNRGLLLYLNNEAQLAGVLGHEVGHVAARHGIKHYQAALGAQLVALGVASLTESRGLVLGTNLLLEAILKGYSRRDELQADRLALAYMEKAGYRPSEMVSFLRTLKRMEKREPGLLEQIFASHPLTSERIRKAELMARGKGGAVARDRYLKRMEGLVCGPGAKEGLIQGRRFRNRHFRYEVTFPPGWRARRGRRIGSVMGKDPSERLLCQAIPLKLPRPLTAREMAHRLERGTHLRRLGEGWVRLGGLTGLRVDYLAGRLRARMVFLPRGQTGFILCCCCPWEYFLWGEGLFEEFLRSFRSLNRREARRIPLWRLKIYRSRPGDTFQSLSRRFYGTPAYAEELRLLNGLPPGPLKPGTLIKVKPKGLLLLEMKRKEGH